MYGDNDNEGLVPQLSKRIGILKKLSKYMSKDKLRVFVSGLFYAKLSYCLPAFWNVFGMEEYKEGNSKYTSFTWKDNHNLQVLQNKVNRMLLDAEYKTPTAELLDNTDTLSVKQMIAFQTAGDHSFSIAREGFLFRGATLFNKLDESLRNETKLERFKRDLRKWVKKNICIKPTPKFPSLTQSNFPPRPDPPPPKPDPPSTQNIIRRYLIPRRRLANGQMCFLNCV